ncbi:MAG: rod shape-determining protein MreD [Inquilinaceae bacterium]
MSGTFLNKLDETARRAAPGCVTFLLVLLGAIPLQIPYYGAVAPSLTLASLYYWSVHRPDLMPVSVVFAIGLFQDILMGAPVGLHAFVYLLLRWLIIEQRRFLVGKSFHVLWIGFAMAGLTGLVLQWLATGLYYGALMPVLSPMVGLLLTLSLFPVLAWLIIQVHRGFLQDA